VTQFPMETCESIGLLKVDFLGLSTLAILRKACELVERYHGKRYDMNNIPYRHDDPALTSKDLEDLNKAFELMSRGETVGVFQLESVGMQQMLRDMRPREFENIVAGVALYRPGPMEFIPMYNRRLHGQEKIVYLHPGLEEILSDTYAIIVYQEQINQIAISLFGYSPADADLMRRAVSKKKDKDLLKHKDIFIRQGPENGVDAETAVKIFDEIEKFANYGFNRSHSADYAVLTIQSAFMKAHYPEEYVTALLSIHSDDSEKIATFLEEARRLKIPILPPDVNYSALNFDIQPDPATGRRGIRFGLAAIKNAGAGALQPIIDAREQDGPFADLEDFCRRVDLRKVGKRTLESLAMVGALGKFGTRQQMVSAVDRMVSFSANDHKDREVGQMNMFGMSSGSSSGADLLENLSVAETTEKQMLKWEKELLGLYVTGRPVDKFRDLLSKRETMNVAAIREELLNDDTAKARYHDKNFAVAGEITSFRKRFTKDNKAMAILQIEDWHDTAGVIDVVIFPRAYEKIERQIENGDLPPLEVGEVVVVGGKFDAQRDPAQLIGENITQNFNVMMAAGDSTYANGHDNLPWMLDEPPAMPTNGHSNGYHAPSNEPPPWAVDADYYDEETGEVLQPAPEPEMELAKAVAPATQGAVGYLVPSVEPQLAPQSAPQSAPQTAPSSDVPPWDEDSTSAHEFDPFEFEAAAPQQRWVMVYFPRSGDDDVDRRRLRKLHGLFISYPGQDRFSIVIEGKKKSETLEFPNHTTGVCDALIRDLIAVVGEPRNVEVYTRPNQG
jgi:DNA polymerase III subunit alpha